MGFKKNWDKREIMTNISRMYHESTSPYNDGFVGWGIKQELYEIKWFLDNIMEKCHTYAGEDEFLKEHEQNKIVRILKDE